MASILDTLSDQLAPTRRRTDPDIRNPIIDLVVGQGTVGKTSVYKALCEQPYDHSEPRTHGVHVDTLALAHPHRADVTMRLGVWDFGGQLEYRATQRFYMTDGSLVMLV